MLIPRLRQACKRATVTHEAYLINKYNSIYWHRWQTYVRFIVVIFHKTPKWSQRQWNFFLKFWKMVNTGESTADDSQISTQFNFFAVTVVSTGVLPTGKLYRKSDSARYTTTTARFDYTSIILFQHHLNKKKERNESQTKSHCATRILNNELHFKRFAWNWEWAWESDAHLQVKDASRLNRAKKFEFFARNRFTSNVIIFSGVAFAWESRPIRVIISQRRVRGTSFVLNLFKNGLLCRGWFSGWPSSIRKARWTRSLDCETS